MPKLNGRIPKYRKHKKSDQAIVTLAGKDHYLGPHGTDVSKQEYDRLVAEYLAAGRRAPSTLEAEAEAAVLKVNDIILPFWEHAQVHYRKPDGTPTSEVDNFRQILRHVRRLFGKLPAEQFGPLKLQALQEHLIQLDWSRKHINAQVSRVKRMFKWAVAKEMVPPAIHEALLRAPGLKKGRTPARETEPVKPVPEEQIESVKPFVSSQVRDLIELQLLTGSRADKLVVLRSTDLKTDNDIWTAQPADHKTAHHEHDLTIYFGPKAQEILKSRMLGRPLDAYLFSAAEAKEEHQARRHEARTTPMSCGNRPGSNRKGGSSRAPKGRYTVASYRRAIQRACEKAYPPPDHLAKIKVEGKKGKRWEKDSEWRERLGDSGWAELKAWQHAHCWSPHQLRHNAGTYIRKEFGVEVARVILGQRCLKVTEIYAELDREKAEAAMRKIG